MPKQWKILTGSLPQEPDHFAAAIESESFFLGDDISLSGLWNGSYDLGDDLIDIEDEQVNAALVEVNSIDDAKLLIENASMTRLPIVVRIHNLDMLEYTLRTSRAEADRRLCLRFGGKKK